jgi:uncharacterized RDD family membrane protein YckC
MNQLIGNAAKPRILAFIIDNLIATVAAIFSVALLRSENPVINGLTLGCTYLAYYLVFEAIWGRTPGKFIQGLEVRKLDGSRCDWKAALIRTGLRVLEADPLLLGGLPAGIAILSSDRKQRIGDKLAGTVVVDKNQIRN